MGKTVADWKLPGLTGRKAHSVMEFVGGIRRQSYQKKNKTNVCVSYTIELRWADQKKNPGLFGEHIR